MGKSLFKTSNQDLESLSAEELCIYHEIVDLLMADGVPEEGAKEAAYLSLFVK
jgi:hypothetical protein